MPSPNGVIPTRDHTQAAAERRANMQSACTLSNCRGGVLGWVQGSSLAFMGGWLRVRGRLRVPPERP